MKLPGNRYAVPVFDFGWGENYVVPQMADEDARTYIQAKCQEWSQGDPEVSVKYADGETINRYRFRVTDQDRQECSLAGGTQTNYQSRFNMQSIPVRVQYTRFGVDYPVDVQTRRGERDS